MRRLWTLLLALLLTAPAWGLPAPPARAEEPEMSIGVSGGEVLPGEASVVSFTVPEDGTCRIVLAGADGETVAVVAEDRPAAAGYNALYWNGTWQGRAVPAGEWTMRLEMNGRTAETAVTVGAMVPYLISAGAKRERVTVGMRVTAEYYATEAGTLRVTVDGAEAARAAAEEGEGEISFTPLLPPGEYTAEMTLEREDGTASPPAQFTFTVEEPATGFTPVSAGNGTDGVYALDGWTVPMDITDEDAVWQALTAPVTVLDDGKSKAQVRQAVIRKEPDAESEGVGTVTLGSQGVRVLERGEEWTKIECYSSSFHDSEVLNWNALVQGYVETGLLREIVPDQTMGLVVDKLTQRLYVFADGKLFSTLLVSTGLANARQPYNETRSGEFLLVSRVGGFYSDNMYCPRAIRFNNGDLLHEVPYVERNETRIYSVTEPKLGTKASHGCIRVQRKKNPEGLNMEWLFTHYRENIKVLVWEDWQGRQIPVPDDGTVFWRHPTRNDYYHCSPACPALGSKFPAEITYAEVSAEDSKLKPCPACGPAPKKGSLAEINAQYAEGGDHDPVLTEARKDCPKPKRR